MRYIKYPLFLLTTFFFLACGGDSGSSNSNSNNEEVEDSKYSIEYKGLHFYYKNLSPSTYKLNQLTSSEFESFNREKKLLVANKLLSTLFFSYPQKELESKIESGSFIDDLKSSLEEERTDKASLEAYILDEEKFQQSNWNEQEAVNILTRFYAMNELDSYYLNNWIAYILTQTIMFSPAYELDSTHTPNITRVYNRIVNFLDQEAGIRYMTYVHMSSEDNWRRFRSPEDNGREMLEIFLLDGDDTHVPIAGKALQNWKLDKDSDTLVVSLNQNRKPLKLFGTTIYNGDDFYRELVKSDTFVKGTTRRLVDFFFPNFSSSQKAKIITSILSSKPETWKDILVQIIFSEQYLLENSRAKSAEETFFSLAKKMNFQHRKGTFHELKYALEEMHQASMKYKLGKLERVPLDTLSFATYYKYIRERIIGRVSNPEKVNDYEAWGRQGWHQSFVVNDGIDYTNLSNKESLTQFINYLFKTLIYRMPRPNELKMFQEHILKGESGREKFVCCFDMFEEQTDLDKQKKKRLENKIRITQIVLEYIVRLEDIFMQKEVK